MHQSMQWIHNSKHILIWCAPKNYSGKCCCHYYAISFPMQHQFVVAAESSSMGKSLKYTITVHNACIIIVPVEIRLVYNRSYSC